MQMMTDVPLTPKILAAAFWELSATEQADFFAELHDLLDGRGWPAHSLGEMQWMYMSDEIEKNPRAKAMACVLASHIFLRATEYLTRAVPS